MEGDLADMKETEKERRRSRQRKNTIPPRMACYHSMMSFACIGESMASIARGKLVRAANPVAMRPAIDAAVADEVEEGEDVEMDLA